MTDSPTFTLEDQSDRLAKLESQIARSERELVKLTQIVLETRAASVVVQREIVDVRDTSIDEDTRRAISDVMGMILHLTRVPFVMRFGFFQRRHQRRLAMALVDCDLVDEKFYSETYPEVAESGMEPAVYFAAKGIEAGHIPHPKFKPEVSS